MAVCTMWRSGDSENAINASKPCQQLDVSSQTRSEKRLEYSNSKYYARLHILDLYNDLTLITKIELYFLHLDI